MEKGCQPRWTAELPRAARAGPPTPGRRSGVGWLLFYLVCSPPFAVATLGRDTLSALPFQRSSSTQAALEEAEERKPRRARPARAVHTRASGLPQPSYRATRQRPGHAGAVNIHAGCERRPHMCSQAGMPLSLAAGATRPCSSRVTAESSEPGARGCDRERESKKGRIII